MDLTKERKRQLFVKPKVTHVMADGSIRDSLEGYYFDFHNVPLQTALQSGFLKICPHAWGQAK